MKRDKEWENRMQGMIYAYNLVKKGGMEALEQDIRRRNFLRAPMKFTAGQIDEFYREISGYMYNNMLTAVCYTLNDNFGFGPKRIRDFKAAFDKNVGCTLDLDYMGEHYVKLEDYAKELNEKFNMGIDVSRVAASQNLYDEQDDKLMRCNVNVVIRELMDNGFFDAAEFLKKKIS